MVPSRVAGGIAQSSSSSGIFFQGDRQSQVDGNSRLSSNFGNTSNLRGLVNLGPLSGDVSNTILNSISSGPSVGASSLVTDANSGLSAGPHLQRSASINTESYMRLPASPMSFTSNNISISGSSVIDGSSSVQPNNQDPGSQHQGSSSATSLPASRMGHVQLPGGPRAPNAFAQDPTAISHLPKRPRLDNMKQEDILQQQVVQQLIQRQDSMHLQNQNPQLQALLQQRLRQQQQQQLLQSMQPMQRGHLLNPQQQQQLRQQLLQQQMQPTAGVKRPYDASVCSRRIMQYLYHQRQRPAVSIS